MSAAVVTKRKSGPVRHLSPEEIARMHNDPRTAIAPEAPLDRSAAEQIDALLRLTNRQVANLERAGVLTPMELGQLSTLASTLSALVSAQRTAAKSEEKSEGELTDEELAAIAGGKTKE